MSVFNQTDANSAWIEAQRDPRRADSDDLASALPVKAHIRALNLENFASRAEDAVEGLELALSRYAPLFPELPAVRELEAAAHSARSALADLYAGAGSQ